MPNVLQILQNNTSLRRYRARISERLQREPAVKTLPSLLDLPLLPSEMTGSSAETLSNYGAFVGLRGAQGSGRSLVLMQIAHHWLNHNQSESLLYLSLARADALNITPRAVLSGAMHATGLPAPIENGNGNGSPARRPWLLLIDDWEVLAEPRRSQWKAFLLTLPETLPEAQVVVALPEHGADWAGFQTITLPPPDEARLHMWLAYLLPQHDPEPIIAELEPGEMLAPLRQRLLEIALLALTYPENGLPASRAQLYEWAYAIDQQHVSSSHAAGFGAGVWGLATSRPQPVPRSQTASGDDGRWTFGIGQEPLQCYEIACSLAAAGNVGPLKELQGNTRAEVSLLLAGMLSDPSPLYAELWNGGQCSPDDLLILGRCLCDRPTVTPEWGVRIVEALLPQRNSRVHRALLELLDPALPAILAAAATGMRDEQAASLLRERARTIGELPLLELVNNTGARPALRWAAAEALLPRPAGHVFHLLTTRQPADTLAQAIYCYVMAQGKPEHCSKLAESVALEWITALHDERVSQEHRTQVVSALLGHRDTPATLRAPLLELMPQVNYRHSEDTQALLVEACVDSVAAVRYAALEALRSRKPQQALQVLGQILLKQAYPWEAQHDALEQLPRYSQGEASVLLARCALAQHLPLIGRLRAIRLLADRGYAGSVLLRRLLRVEAAHPLVRAAALQLLAHQSTSDAPGDICQIATSDTALLARQSAIEALSRLGQQTRKPAEAQAGLSLILTHDIGHIGLAIPALQALGAIGHAESVPLLIGLLKADIASRIRAFWLTHLPDIESLPVDKWGEAELSTDTRVMLVTMLTEGETDADQPTSFREFVAMQTTQVCMAVAQALARIAHRSNATVQQKVRASLLNLLQRIQSGQEASQLLICLRQASSDDGLSDLAQLLSNPTLSPSIRWLVVEHLGENPAAEPLLVRSLEQGIFDDFTRSKLAYTLGMQRSFSALPMLRQIAEQRDGDLYLRKQAIMALGLYADPAIETTLLHIVADVTTAPTLRGAAAEALPTTLRADMRRWLYELLRRERQPPELVAGVLHTLGRARDREALSLMLRYVQSDIPTIAMAALNSLAELGDPDIAPNLVRVTQNSNIDQSIRLHALRVLLKLCGGEYLPLLRSYLESSVLSLQLPAFDCLMEMRPDEPLPLMLLTHKTAPMALRLRAIDALQQRTEEHGVFCNLLKDHSDDLHLRMAVASALEVSAHPEAVPTLARCIRDTRSPLRLRRQCITALQTHAIATRDTGNTAHLDLSQIADDPALPAEIQGWASLALLHLLSNDVQP